MDSTLLSPQYRKALDLVAVLFESHKRKITGVPYIVHLTGVCHIVAQADNNEDTRVAALLHDVLEDIPARIYDETKMRQDFGDSVADIVKAVTIDTERYGRDGTKEYLNQIKSGPKEACTVSAADMLYNIRDFIDNYSSHKADFIKIFGGEKAMHREWFLRERLQILADRLGADHRIIQEIKPLLTELSAIHQEIQ